MRVRIRVRVRVRREGRPLKVILNLMNKIKLEVKYYHISIFVLVMVGPKMDSILPLILFYLLNLIC